MILIEFAFSVPVFLAFIYYAHDLPKQKRLQRKIQFVAHEMAMILQNIASKRAITKQDLITAMRLAYLSVFPGMTMQGTQNRSHSLGYYPYAAVMYVKGVEQNLVQGKWIAKVTTDNGYPIYLDKNVASVCNWGFFEQSTDASKFWPTLKISENESRLIIQCHLAYDRLWKWGDKFTDGTYCKNVSSRKAFGFLFLEPKGVGTAGGGFFTSTIIVTPNSGFTENFPR